MLFTLLVRRSISLSALAINEGVTVNKAIMVILSVIVLMMFFGVEDRPVLDSNYCEMVEMHIQSQGENGWPDYKGNYSEACQ